MKNINKWQIYFKLKFEQLDFQVEKFLTGGQIYYYFKEAQSVKKSLQKMSGSLIYKVVRIE